MGPPHTLWIVGYVLSIYGPVALVICLVVRGTQNVICGADSVGDKQSLCGYKELANNFPRALCSGV